MQTQRLRGVVVPIITPIDAEEKVDEAGLRRLIRRLEEAGVHGLFVGGSAGEGPLLPEDQWRKMAEVAFDEVKGRMPLLGGVMDTSSRRVCEKVKVLRAIGYSHFVATHDVLPGRQDRVRAPAAFRGGAGGRRKHGDDRVQHSPVHRGEPCGRYALRDGQARLASVLQGKLRGHDILQGPCATRRRDRAFGLAGDEVTLLEELQAGAAGIVPGCGNIVPAVFIQAFEAAERSDWTEVAHIHREIMRIRAPLVTGGPSWLSGIKYAASLMGSGSGKAMSPLEPVSPLQKQDIERLLCK